MYLALENPFQVRAARALINTGVLLQPLQEKLLAVSTESEMKAFIEEYKGGRLDFLKRCFTALVGE